MERQITITEVVNNGVSLTIGDTLVQFFVEVCLDKMQNVSLLQQILCDGLLNNNDIFCILKYNWVKNEFVSNEIALYPNSDFMEVLHDYSKSEILKGKHAIIPFNISKVYYEPESLILIKRLYPNLIAKDCYYFRLTECDIITLMELCHHKTKLKRVP